MTILARTTRSLTLWRKLFRLLRFSSPTLSLLVAALSVVEAASGIAALWFVKQLVDQVPEGLGQDDGLSNPLTLFTYLALTGLMMVLAAVFQRLTEYASHRQGAEVADHVDGLIHDRAIAVDLGFYESPLYHDSLQRARAAGSHRPAKVISTIVQFFRSIIYLVGILALMSALDWRLVPILLAGMGAALAVRLYFTRILFQWRHRQAQMERRASYLDWLLTSEHHAKELRIGALGGFLRDRYSQQRRQIRSEELAIERRKMLAEVIAATGATLIFMGAATWLILRVIEGSMGLGDLVLFLLLFKRAEASGREFVTSLSGLYDHQLYLSQLFEFFAVQPTLRAPATSVALPQPLREGIRFEGASFSYPGNGAPALSGVDFTLGAGQVTAIVGENGSGKTSLIKLLCRLYDPDQGRITLDGIDIRDFDPAAYRRIFSVIFQDYARYAETAAENIRFGDVTIGADSARIAHAADLGGASTFIADLPQGLQTPLTRLFDDGRELSLGQWQRLALSRAFFPASQFVIMDEPTSAVDPRAEAELFENFRARLEGRGALIISHRLSTIRMADRIYMLDEGRILESGTHDELIRQNGRYAALFARQARAFLSADIQETKEKDLP
ncbi:MAG: ABC transporter ATP-binding protein [Paracoccaceae bacterium]